jgi:hypothetical protein
VNPEPDNDRLDAALRLRRVAAPPHEFTRRVLRRVSTESRRSQPAELLAEHGVRAGLALAACGASVVVDLNGPAATLAAALQAPEAPTVIAVLAICVTYILARQEPEADAL